MNLSTYRRGDRYAMALSKENHRDILHDAYLRWFDKKGADLFDEKPNTVFHVIKLTFLDSLKKEHKYWYYSGERFNTIIGEFSEQLFNQTTPEDEYISAEVKKNFDHRVRNAASCLKKGPTSHMITIYELLCQEYRPHEISDFLGISRGSVSHVRNQLRNLN